MILNKNLLVLTYLAIFFTLHANADTINIAVASNFSQPAKEIANRFKQQTGSSVLISTGASGTLYNQIKNGAPYTLLLAADETTSQKLAEEGYALKASQFTYATGQLVLWSSQKNFVDSKGRILFTGKFHHLAIANPKIAPYGLAAQSTITKLQLENTLKDKIVQGDNIGSTYQYVASGNAELGFVALSQVYYKGKIVSGSAWIVPSELYPAIKQDAILTVSGEKSKTAQEFLNFLKTPAAKEIMSMYGYK